MLSYRQRLADEFASRKARNSRYSLRSFARFLGVSRTALSDVISEKRHLSRKNAALVADRLRLATEEARAMLREIDSAAPSRVSIPYRQLDEDTFRLIADWYHFAILNLARIKTNQADPRWVAERLRITTEEARRAITRLKRLGYLAVEDGRLKRTVLPLHTPTGNGSAALKEYHKQNLRLAEYSMEHDARDTRENTSVTMAIAPSRIPAAKRMIIEFRNRLGDFLESDDPSEVYTLAIQLYPVTRGEKS